MKKIILFAFLLGNMANAQTINGDYLDINNIKARFNSEGSMFNEYGSSFNNAFEVPQGTGTHSIFAGGLWIGGIDAGGTLKVAAQTYRQTGTDFWPGPLTSLATTDSATIAYYNRVWKVNKCDIDNYYNWVAVGGIGPNPVSPAGMAPINDWPAFTLDGQPLAPFWDVNGNGAYEPWLGEVPEIKGDQAIFFVYNDKGGIHTETGGASIGIEIQGMAYAYSCTDNDPLYNTVFTHYKIINKSSFRLDSAFIGNWTDMDIGGSGDDFVACDVMRGAYYGYNGDSLDPMYGLNPPAQAITFLSGPYADSNGVDDAPGSVPLSFLNYGDGTVDNERLGMSKFLYYNNDGTSTGNPTGGTGFYNYMTGSWQDGTPWTYGGTGHLTGMPCDYIFPGSSDPLGYGTNMIPQPPWDEVTEGNIPSDRRGIGSMGPFTMHPGSVNELDFAYVFGRATSGGNLASVLVMREYVDSIKLHFGNPNLSCGCDGLTSINNIEAEESFSLYPNPANDIITLKYESASNDYTMNIFDITGRILRTQKVNTSENTISISELEAGIYLISILDEGKIITKRFVKH